MRKPLSVKQVWGTGLWFAVLGMIPSFLRVHYETLRILPAVLRSLDASGLPIPESLAWSTGLVRWISAVGSATPIVRATLLPLIFAILVVIAVRVALPPFRLGNPDRQQLWRLVALMVGWVLATLGLAWWFVWRAERPSLENVAPFTALSCLIAGLLLSADGAAGRLQGVRERLSPWPFLRLVVGSVGCGLVGALVLQFTSFDFGAALYRFMFDFPAVFAPPFSSQGLADLNPRGWVTFLLISLGIAAAGGFCWGSLWTAVVAPAESYHQRTRALAAAMVPLALVTSGGVWLFFGVVLGRMDYGRPLVQMAEREQIPFGPAGVDTVLIPAGDGASRVARIPFQTIVGFPNEPGVTYKVEQYLQTRRYQTTLARALFVHLHDVRSIDWDPVRSLEVDRLCIEQAPRLQFVQLMVETLSNCAVTPEAKRYLDWLDARARPYRQSQSACQTMGDLYARFGDAQKAQEWYERGEIPDEIRQPPVKLGRVTGRIVWNDQPAEGVRVGVIRQDRAFLFTRRRGEREEGVLILRPFDWRVVAGVVATDASGRFELPPLPYGEYVLMLRVESVRLPAVPGVVKVEGLPAQVKLDASTKDIGTVNLRQKGDERRGRPPERAI